MSLRVLSLGFVTPIATLLMFSTVQAQLQRYGNQALQQQQMQQMQMQQMQPIKSVGKLVTANANQIEIKNGAGQTVYVMIGQDTEVSVTGAADLDYLKSGVTVEFLAEVAKGGTVKQKIAHLSVVTPTTDRPIGLLSPDTIALDQKKAAKDDEEKANPVAPDNGVGKAAPAKGAKSGKNDDLFGSTPAAKATNAATKSGSARAIARHVYGAGNDQVEQERQHHAWGRSRPDDQGRPGRRRHNRRLHVRCPHRPGRRQGHGERFCQPDPAEHGDGQIDCDRVGQSALGREEACPRPAAKTPTPGKAPPAKKEAAGAGGPPGSRQVTGRRLTSALDCRAD